MKSLARVPMLLLFCLSIAAGAALGRAADTGSPQGKAKQYVCAPCGMPCDEKVYDHPGNCPVCGVQLVDKEEAEAAARSVKKVAILIFTGVQIIDYTGPYEIFQAAGFNVYTVAATKDPITTVAGMIVTPKYTFADAPQPDVLVVPGGGIRATLQSPETLAWIKDVTAKDLHTMSVCNGAFLLAGAGLLDGLKATTTAGNIDRLTSQYPKVTVVRDQRVVDNGHILTTGGLTAGIDGALHVVEVLLGKGQAQSVALGEEYDWHPDFARGALADTLVIPYLDEVANATGKWEVVTTEGDTRRWLTEVRGTSDKSAAELLAQFDQAFVTRGKWTSVTSAATGSAGSTSNAYRFSGPDGKPWSGTLSIDPITGQGHQYTVTVSIEKAG
jgi:putative intracellular protease/amidase/DNA-directed RNA polymerase subunit RPC12/RpoP